MVYAEDLSHYVSVHGHTQKVSNCLFATHEIGIEQPFTLHVNNQGIVLMSVGPKLNAVWVLFGGATLGIVLALYLNTVPTLDRRDVAEQRPYQRMIESANAHIAAQSVGNTNSPAVSSAPRMTGTLHLYPTTSKASSRPPEGYTFVDFDGEMSLDRIKGDGGTKSDQEAKRHEWLDASTSIARLVSLATQENRDWTFGWLRITEHAKVHDLEHALHEKGASVIGSAGNLVRARLPGEGTLLQAIADLPEINGIGVPPVELKIRAVVQHAKELRTHEKIPVFVTLMLNDPNQRWRRELEDLGAVVGRFDPSIRVYAASATFETLERIAERDFVLAIEPILVVKAAHDTAVPAMGADALRAYDGSTGLFSGIGGSTTAIAVMDTGLNTNHLDISTNRSSICGANFVFFEPRIDDQDLWVDAGIHGTHVTGTIVGNGTAETRYAGMAPLVQHIRFAKVLSHNGIGNDFFILRGMDFLAERTACPEFGWSGTEVKPLIVNMSLSASARFWEGRGVAERKLDSIVWRHRQLYVVAQSNESISGFSNYGTAKNSLAVGAALDSGNIAGFSSHGPTADGRLAPQVVGTGVSVYSAAGDDSRDGYIVLSGTSMASPAVAGVAALLMDANPSHREEPALTRARLMASAIKPDFWFEDAALFPTDNSNGPGDVQTQYGLGKVSARTSVLNKDATDGWSSSSAIAALHDGEYAYHDIDVPAGTSRLDLVLTWDEPPTDTVASAVLNDLDLWLDRGGDCDREPCGEYVSTSRIDNVEWIIVSNPPAGTYRAKIVASRVYTDPPRAAIAWTIVRGASTPSLEISTDEDVVDLQNRDPDGDLKVSVKTDSYVAAGTRLFMDCRTVAGGECSHFGSLRVSTNREDGVDPKVTAQIGDSIEVGELAVGETWTAHFQFLESTVRDHDSFRLYFKASAWNANADSTTVLMDTNGTDEADSSEDKAPLNDRFSDASLIEGEQGSIELDLLHARTEFGESIFSNQLGRPAGSVWYEWTSPSNKMVSFNLVPDPDFDSIFASHIDVFNGDRITSLEHVTSAAWGVQFFAESGEKYLIRISHAKRSVPLTLNWSVGSRPANDQFLTAIAIEDVSGSIEGTNAGATLEGEFFGTLAATVWYRWTAPSDGAWEFGSNMADLLVLTFIGERLSELRLVSALPSQVASFKAQGGKTYHVAVASRNAYATGLPYELSWKSVDREVRNDDFHNAIEIPGDMSSSYAVDIDSLASVEPDEPSASGIRTKWWSWTAPADGNYTWRIEELTRRTSGVRNRLMVSAFSGDSLNDLQLVATNGAEMSTDWVMPAFGGQDYLLAAGFPANYQWAFTNTLGSANATLEWGPTPKNDSFSNAVLLSSTNGSIAASNFFATTDRGERTGQLGHSSVWWKFIAPEAGWYRFWIEEVDDDLTFAIYKAGDRLASLDLVEFGIGSDTEIVFHAVEEEVYAIRVGTRGSSQGHEFTFHWEAREAPISLLYLSQLAPGGADPAGNTVEFRNLRSFAINSSGDAVYLSSELGLHVFERDRESGELTFLQLIEGSLYNHRELIWDDKRDRLLAILCYEWYAFSKISEESQMLQYDGRLELAFDHRVCNEEDVLIDRDGAFIYLVARVPKRLQVMSLEPEDKVRHVQTLEIDDLVAAELTNDERQMYAVTNGALLSFERDGETGELNQLSSQPLSAGIELAISDDDQSLFVIEENGGRATVLSLIDYEQPERLGSISQNELTYCGHATVRPGTPSVDVFCGYQFNVNVPGGVFTVSLRTLTNEVVLTGSVIGSDVLGNSVPDSFTPIDIVASPDGRHVYVATFAHGILTFERFGD